jgi:hypothetical protein
MYPALLLIRREATSAKQTLRAFGKCATEMPRRCTPRDDSAGWVEALSRAMMQLERLHHSLNTISSWSVPASVWPLAE